MPVSRNQKQSFISYLNVQSSNFNCLFLIHFRGLTVKEIELLRKELFKHDSSLKIAKNTLINIAFNGTSFSKVFPLLNGPIAIVFASDPVAVAKVLNEFVKECPSCQIVGAYFNNNLLTASEVTQLAKLPSLNEIRANIISLINAPIQKLLSVIQAPSVQIACIIQAFSENK